MTSPATIATLRVSEVGEYVRHRSCERRFKLEINKRAVARRLPFADRLFNALDPVLQEEGRRREDEWEASLKAAGLRDLTGDDRPDEDEGPPTWEVFAAAAAGLATGEAAFGREVRVEAQLGSFVLHGRIDFVLILWRDDRPVLRLVECKASRRDRTYQRIQVCLYVQLVRQLLAEQPVVIGGMTLGAEDVESVVARIDEATNESHEILHLEPFDLSLEAADAERLLADDGPLAYIVRAQVYDLAYQLDEKCDGCVFNVDCLPDSARLRRHELLGLTASTAAALRRAGVTTLDDLAELDVTSAAATTLRSDAGFTDSLERLTVLARVRRKTLPGGDEDPDTYPVTPLPHAPRSQLPPHAVGADRLVRVYLAVDYDYTENRLGALSAHVTNSEGQLHTDFMPEDPENPESRRVPNPEVQERVADGQDAEGKPRYVFRALQGRDIARYKGSDWSGRYEEDTGAERELIQGFIRDLVDAIAEVAQAPQARLHFYVWSRSEMTRLVEACSRASSNLLGALRELLGCRESLEQLIFSCVGEEVDRRYALGWTGRGLSVVTSLRWFGRVYHWRRMVAGASTDLDRVFTQDLFDFKTTLGLTADNEWAKTDLETALKHRFEIRSRFHDTLTAPYWRAAWGTLPDPDAPELSAQVSAAIRRYNEAAQPGRLTAYLKARVHAVRWVEEGVRFKNDEISKPLVDIADLHRFTLGVSDTARAGIDFLRLDHFVKGAEWLSTHLLPPANRVPTGRTIPVSEVFSHGNGQLAATIDLIGHGLTLDDLEARCPFGVGAMVRLSPHSGDPNQGQTVGQLLRGGRTCVITGLDWETGQVTLSEMFTLQTRYVLHSGRSDPGDVFDHATIDESPSDFVAPRVEGRLIAGLGTHVFDWFDPENPQIPPAAALPEARRAQLLDYLRTLELGERRQRLADDQVAAVLEGLESRVQLLQGPPGTGKTQTTAAAVLTRLLTLPAGTVVLVAANTHTAVDNLLLRIAFIREEMRSHAATHGLPRPAVNLAKVWSSSIDEPLPPPIRNFVSKPSVRIVNNDRNGAVLVIGGTTPAVLKLAAELSQRNPWATSPAGFTVPLLVVDEASMMVFPHFLALATLVGPQGSIMLAGDHRQLSPILAHDWEREDRPPAVIYQPYASAYNAILRISEHPQVTPAQLRRSALEFTFRLPPVIVDLIARLYRLDEIELQGLELAPAPDDAGPVGEVAWDELWRGETGLFLVLHDERRSRQSNEVEVEIIRTLLEHAPELAPDSVAIITPHRAQRALLGSRVGELPEVGLIDTVERIQGGERPVVIVSGTASDPSAVSVNERFLLDLNRSNVAFSRAQERLIVVCSRSLLDHVPAQLEDYQAALLWKSLRGLCTRSVGTVEVVGHTVRLLTVSVPTDAAR